MALHRPKLRTLQNPRFIQFFSSSSSNGGEDNNNNNNEPHAPPPPPPSSSFSSSFSDVKASLRQQPPPLRRPSSSSRFNEPPSFSPQKPLEFEELRKQLSQFRRSTSSPPLGSDDNKSSQPPLSFRELLSKNVVSKGDESANNNTGGGGGLGGKRSFDYDAIREKFQFLRNNTNQAPNNRFGGGPIDRGSGRTLDLYSKSVQESFNLRHEPGLRTGRTSLFGGSETLPSNVFGKELGLKNESESQGLDTEFVRTYDYKQLGEKLRNLRPSEIDGKKDWFSLEELNERLRKLRQLEVDQKDSPISGITYNALRESLQSLKKPKDDLTRSTSLQGLSILGHLRGGPVFNSPPKEELVERYFHPDNMSSQEKLKLELQRVRDEFKMSESDCGSSRVQVAQLTTKIKHLSSVLHKKDKHSRKGLQAMVQQRKKLLKYLRRTDWDSYCLVLSKLGLRDNPDYKH